MRVAASAFVLVAGAVAPAQVAADVERFAAAMQGCWNRSSWSPEVEASRADPGFSLSSQICLAGGVSGALTLSECSGGGDLVECSSNTGRYEFRDEKFWRRFDDGALAGGIDNCDVRLSPGRSFEVLNCEWTSPPAYEAMPQDAVYARAIGQ